MGKRRSEFSAERLEVYDQRRRRKPPVLISEYSVEEISAILSNLKNNGLSKFRPQQIGDPCIHGHPWSDRYVLTERGKQVIRCRTCRQETSARAFEKLKLTPEIIKERNNRPASKQRRFELHLLLNYGMSFEEWLKMWHCQNGQCVVCHKIFPTNIDGTPKFGMEVHVDHDHHTDKIRELLCFSCNRMIGILEHERAPALLEYMLRHGSTLGRSPDLL